MHAALVSPSEPARYGAAELKASARDHLVRALGVGSVAWIVLFLVAFAVLMRARGVPSPAQNDRIEILIRDHVLTRTEIPREPPTSAPWVAVKPAGRILPVVDAVASEITDRGPVDSLVNEGATGDRVTEATGRTGEVAEPPPPGPNEFVPVDELPELVLQPAPIYPSLAIEAHVEGRVMVKALVGIDGRVHDVLTLVSIPLLDAAARDGVRKWVFRPALVNGHPKAVWVAVPVQFSLH